MVRLALPGFCTRTISATTPLPLHHHLHPIHPPPGYHNAFQSGGVGGQNCTFSYKFSLTIVTSKSFIECKIALRPFINPSELKRMQQWVVRLHISIWYFVFTLFTFSRENMKFSPFLSFIIHSVSRPRSKVRRFSHLLSRSVNREH